MIFLDTSAIYALADRADPNHSRAKRLFSKAIREGEDLLIHSYVLVEAAALIQSRLGLEPALRFLKESASFVVHWVTPTDHREGVKLLEKRGKRRLSLVDCVSFVVMRRYGVKLYLAFDEDFEREGFEPFG